MAAGIPADRLSRVAAYDGFGSVAMIPVATALAGPAADAFGRSTALWGCSALVVVLTGAVLTAPELRSLTRTAVATNPDVTARVAAAVPPRDGQPTVKAPSGGSGEGAAALS